MRKIGQIVGIFLSPLGSKRKGRHATSERQYKSYAEALESTLTKGYENDELVDVIIAKTIAFAVDLETSKFLPTEKASTLLGLVSASQVSDLRVLDFGGGAGADFFSARKILGANVSLKWNVVETPAMVSKARHSVRNPELTFFTEIQDAAQDLGRIDLIFSNSSLPYSPSPMNSLAELIKLGASFIYITRTLLAESDETIHTVQTSRLANNGPGPLAQGFLDRDVAYPLTMVSRRLVEEKLGDEYTIRFMVDEGRARNTPEGIHARFYSYFGELKPG